MKIFLFIIGVIFGYYLPQKVPIPYYICYLCLLFFPTFPNDVLTCFLYCLFLQDLQTMYISKKWIFPSLFIASLFLYQYWNISSSLVALIAYGLPVFLLFTFKKDWIGSADVCFISYFSLLLGYQRMSVAILISTLSALLFCVLFRKKEVPFLCFLSFGIYFSVLFGYRIWYAIFNFILGVS